MLARHPAVSEAVSFAIPDDMYGQDIGVAVVLKPGAELTADEMKRWVADKLANYKVPKKVSFPIPALKTRTKLAAVYPAHRTVSDMAVQKDLLHPSHAQDGDREDQRRIVAETMQKQEAKAKL